MKELLHDRARDADYDDYFTCHELCSITLFENGVFEVSPGLSQPVSDALLALGAGSSVEALQRTTSTAAASLTVFLDDASAEHAVKRGLALSARRLRTLQGREFVYSVYNSREVWSSVRLEAMQREKGVHEAVRASEHRPYLPLKPATSFPHLQHHLFLLELRSAEGFQCSQLMTAYDIALPPKWTLLSPSSSSSDTSLQGMTHFACRSTADTSSVARLLLALFVLLLSCASVTLGFNGDRGSSALYLAPCLLLLVLGFVRIRSHRDLHSDNFDDTLVLNHTLQLRCASPADTGDTAHAQESLTISLQVFSQGAFGRSLLEGEALLSIPARALTKDDGEYEAQVLELQGGVHSQMQALFLGQRPALKTEHSASFLGLPAVDPNKSRERSTARLGSRSRIAGTIRIRMQRIVMHAPGNLQQEQKQMKGGLSDPKPSARAELQRLRASFSSNRAASSSTPTSAADGQPSARPSVRSILDALGSGSSNLSHAKPLDRPPHQQQQPSEDVSAPPGLRALHPSESGARSRRYDNKQDDDDRSEVHSQSSEAATDKAADRGASKGTEEVDNKHVVAVAADDIGGERGRKRGDISVGDGQTSSTESRDGTSSVARAEKTPPTSARRSEDSSATKTRKTPPNTAPPVGLLSSSRSSSFTARGAAPQSSELSASEAKAALEGERDGEKANSAEEEEEEELLVIPKK